jgi:hypothetical protein
MVISAILRTCHGLTVSILVVLALLSGGYVGWHVCLAFPSISDGPDILPVAVAAVVTVVVAVLVFGLLYRFAWRRLRYYPGWLPLAWCAACVVFVWLAYTVFRYRAPPCPWTGTRKLTIVATGEKNAAARASEVWVRGLYRPDGTRVDPQEFELQGDWQHRDDALLSHRNQPATLRWRGRLRGRAKLLLVTHPWSGVVAITWDGAAQRRDLFAPTSTSVWVELPAREYSDRLLKLYRQAMFAGHVASLAVALVVISVWSATRGHPRPTTPRMTQALVTAALSVAVLTYGLSRAPRGGAFSWPSYARRVTGSQGARRHRLDDWCAQRDFYREHIPRGSVVLTRGDVGRQLVAMHDCYVVGVTKGAGLAYRRNPRLQDDERTMLAGETPWEQRRNLLKRYAVEHVLLSETAYRRATWLQACTGEKWERGGMVVVRIATE